MGQSYIGERFGDYKLVRLLGEGGFASVYLGQEVHDGTFAAVKLLKEQQVHDFITVLPSSGTPNTPAGEISNVT